MKKNNYTETLDWIEQAKDLLEKIEKNVESQINQELGDQFSQTKAELTNWLEEIEFTLGEYTEP